MANPGLSREKLERAAKAYFDHNGVSAHAARSLKMPENTFRNQIKRAAEAGLLGTDPVVPGFAISKISTTEDADGRIKSRSIQQTPAVDLEPFQMPDGQAIKGVSALLDGEGNVKQQWVKTDRKAQEAL
jgi:hypothetical protein